MSEQLCSNCQYFIQHYTFDRNKIFRVYCGHCMFKRTKQRRPTTKACESFIPGPAQEDAFASKEYLSKELLRYILKLELLPKIEDSGFPPSGQCD